MNSAIASAASSLPVNDLFHIVNDKLHDEVLPIV